MTRLSAAAQNSLAAQKLRRAGIAASDSAGNVRSVEAMHADIKAKQIDDPVKRLELKRAAERIFAGLEG